MKTNPSDRLLQDLIRISREYGANPDFVVAGGGNTSVKTEDVLIVKASGTALSEASAATFVTLDRRQLAMVLNAVYPDDAHEREAAVKRGLLRAMRYPDRDGRPSVEASLHDLISYRFVVHTHPWNVNALTCSKNGMTILRDRFADRALTLPYCDPGYTLARRLKTEIDRFVRSNGSAPQIIFLGNHGLFVAADSIGEIRTLTDHIIATCSPELTAIPKPTSDRQAPPGTGTPAGDRDTAVLVNVVRSVLSTDMRLTTHLNRGPLAIRFASDSASFRAVALPFTPDQIVYCGSHPLYVPVPATSAPGSAAATAAVRSFLNRLTAYRKRHGTDPKVISIQGIGTITVGPTLRDAETTAAVFTDAMKIAHASERSGGPKPMNAAARAFIEAWEVEHYRRSLAAGRAPGGSRTAVVTGGAQGFGEGIVRALHATGYNVVVADVNEMRGAALAAELAGTDRTDNNRQPSNGVRFVRTDVSEEESVARLMDTTILSFGGCDLFISNAGVLRAGGLEEIDGPAFDLMTSVNYRGYFICAKYAARTMKRQYTYAPHLLSDIIQINSKSGLVGSNKNFTYAGGKFGGIGLTQSFALELIPYRIKVNAICPGNFLDGPLWSDPERGLFVQYLRTGKVPGAKSVDDVRRAYESKVPAGRGCTIADVMKAIDYVVDQEYETGQAVPVTGGQVMLK